MKLGHKACPSCPSSDAFYMWPDGHGYCFSCGYYSAGTTAQTLRARIVKDIQKVSSSIDIADYTYQLDPAAIKWLAKYDITKEEVLKNRLMWNNKTSSLVFPLFDNEKLVATCERHFGNLNLPKYLTRGYPHKNLQVLRGKDGSRLILTEDFVSAMKVARICDSLPLLGAHVPTSLISQLHRLSYNNVSLWLDMNKAQKSIELTQRMSQVLRGVRSIITTLDPKEYSTQEIRRLVL